MIVYITSEIVILAYLLDVEESNADTQSTWKQKSRDCRMEKLARWKNHHFH